MIIKHIDFLKTSLTPFDLLGTNEVGLSKAFAYVLSNSPEALYRFLQFVGIKIKNTKQNYCKTQIIIEQKRDEGRTDIEIMQSKKYHVIIESKVSNNKIKEQRTQYLNSFDDAPQKLICFITQTNDYKKQVLENISIQNIGWIEIANLYDSKEFYDNSLTKNFLRFLLRGYKMRNQKEILIQDLSDDDEMKRYRQYQVYRRNIIYGSPLYFAPYFTRNAKQPEGEGISFLSKVLGILSLKPKEINNYKDDLLTFANRNKDIVNKWLNGVNIDSQSDETFTYFFLDKPVILKKPLLKDGTRKKGRGKNWIAAMIPPNRCVTFEEFVKRMVE